MRKHDLTNVFFIIFVILTIFHTFDNFHWQFVTIKFFIREKLTICKYLSLFTIFQFSWQFLHFLIIFLQFWPILTITNNVLNGRKNLHRWPRSVPSPSRLASLFKIFWCVNYIQVGSSPSNPMHAYSFWVCCGATSICDGTVYNLPQMGTHLPAWYMVWYMAHVTLHTTQQSNEATKQRGNEKQDNVATKQRGNKTATQRSNEVTKQWGNEARRRRSNEATRQRSNEATRQQGITHLPVLCLCGTWQTVQAKRQQGNITYLPVLCLCGTWYTWHTVQATRQHGTRYRQQLITHLPVLCLCCCFLLLTSSKSSLSVILPLTKIQLQMQSTQSYF